MEMQEVCPKSKGQRTWWSLYFAVNVRGYASNLWQNEINKQVFFKNYYAHISGSLVMLNILF